MSENKPELKVVNPDAAKTRVKSFFQRHKTKIVGTAATLLVTASFVAGRKSADVVDVDVEFTDPSEPDTTD